jgi:hypothetical protein
MTKRRISVIKSLAITFSLMLVVSINAQEADSLLNLPNLLFPKFTKGIVKLKDGKMYTAMLNYETVEQAMVFLQKKLTLRLENPELVDTIYLYNKVFIPFEKGFYEVVLKAPITFFIQHKSYVESLGTPVGYGAMSQTTSSSYVRQVFGSNGAIGLRIPPDFKVVDDSDYWVRWINGMEKFSSKAQFLRIFSDKEKALKQFIAKNDIDFKNNLDLINLFTYVNELYK